MSGIAEALAKHHYSHADWDENEIAVMCHCGAEIVGQDNGEEAYTQEEALYAQHLASALTTAGFGDVREAQAEAWAEGWAHYRKFYNPHFVEWGNNPYLAALTATEAAS